MFLADVTDEAQVRALEQGVRERFGRVDILINNAGMNIRKPMVEYTLDEWNMVLDTNLTSVFLVTRSIIPMMTGRGYGRIINLASMMSHVSLPGRTAYSASKAALLGVTRALAQELAGRRDHGGGDQPGAVRDGNEPGTDRQSGAEPAVRFEHPPGALGQGGGDREAGALFVFGGGRIHYRLRYCDRRRVDFALIKLH